MKLKETEQLFKILYIYTKTDKRMQAEKSYHLDIGIDNVAGQLTWPPKIGPTKKWRYAIIDLPPKYVPVVGLNF